MTLHAFLVGTVVTVLLTIGSGCSKREKNEPARSYRLRGYVLELDPNTNLASIHNERIEGWMSEMTMAYPVENPEEYLSLRKGEKITATVRVSSEGFWLTNVKERKGD